MQRSLKASVCTNNPGGLGMKGRLVVCPGRPAMRARDRAWMAEVTGSHGEAAIHDEHLAGDEASIGGAEEGDGCGYLVGGAEAL